MEYNKSLSARIRHRNKQGFEGIGNPNLTKNNLYGDYTDQKQNHKETDYKLDLARKK